MTGTRTACAILILSLVGLTACSREALDAVLSGRCEEGTTHCVDSRTIQYCQGEVWQEPEDCLPDIAGSGGVQVEIITYCSEVGCRPGG